MSIDNLISKHINFKVEDLRNKYALKNNLLKFRSLYNKRENKNLTNYNTGTFWDSKFSNQESLISQDKMTKEKIEWIANLIKTVKQPIKILDIGIGQAYLEQELKRNKVKFILSAIDISRISIERAKKNYSAEAFTDDALRIDKHFKPISFDVVVAIEVIEHISPVKIFSFYKKVHSLIKDGGLFIISTPLNEGLRYMQNNPSAHVRDYTVPILKTEFKLANFKIIASQTLIAFKNYYTLKKTVARLLPNRWKPNNIIIVARKL